MKLQGEVAVITGGATGIGRSLALSLARAGMKIAIADIDLDGAEKTCREIEAAGGQAIWHETDVTSIDSLNDLAGSIESRLGSPYLICNNAGVMVWDTMHEVSQDDWNYLFAVNVQGVMNGIRAFLPRLLEQGQGHILNTASLGGHAGFPGMGPYIPSKFCVVGISEVLRLDLADTPIGVSVLCPGNVKSAIAEKTLRWFERSHKEPGKIARARQLIDALDSVGMETSLVGELVRMGLEANDFYIFTSISNPSSREVMESRYKEITAALDTLDERLERLQTRPSVDT